MFNSDEFESFVKIMDGSSATVVKGHCIIKFESPIDDIEHLNLLLNKYGVTTVLEKRKDEFVISAEFSEDSILFLSMDKLWYKSYSIGKVPEFFYVFKGNESSLEKSRETLSISLFLKWKEIITRVSNHTINDKCILYMPNDDGGKELVITLSESLNFVNKINYKIDSNLSADNILKVLDVNDAQSTERESIMRTAIFELIKDKEDKSLLAVIDIGDKIYVRYQNLLELYTKRFSVNKILSELEQKKLDYTTKINDFVSSSQSKAFAIPGALIAVGGLAKSGGFWDSVLIFIGLYLIYRVTYISNEILIDSYSSLKDSLDDLIKRYSKFDEGIEVRSAASKIDKDIKIKIKKAEERIEKINGMGVVMLIVSAIYLFIKWLMA
ncbi:hypothetical protein EO986_06920 [Morganella morganii subsp. morganii]|uniref:hypothetical protein n=1 Tax=Morganella morganii TaxID=582 RepID=UPI000E058941|nr:hypothetical protein [Morganella morganii]QCY20787.1 hypothetical protein EO986_06920 [Morganella morganii subsp. morganii]STZ12032.1 Uncharacterised protein [Morganella morganii]